jgi:hypothetical protein
MRSGKLFSINDDLIEELINNPLYDVRSDGTVWSLITLTGKKSVKNQWRKCGAISINGYYAMGYNNRKILLHRVIYRKFNGQLFKDLVINHKDGNRLNNLPSNLELVTQSNNNEHKYQVLNCKPSVTNAKINKEIADQIREDRKQGYTLRQLTNKYNLTKSTLSYIINYKIWI